MKYWCIYVVKHVFYEKETQIIAKRDAKYCVSTIKMRILALN